jgi:ATP-dependent DNA helicase RecG
MCEAQGLPAPDFQSAPRRFETRFTKDPYTDERLRDMGMNERQIQAVAYVRQHGRITNAQYCELNTVSRGTATRDLTDLLDRGVFARAGSGKRNLCYTLPEGRMRQKRGKNEAKDAKASP